MNIKTQVPLQFGAWYENPRCRGELAGGFASLVGAKSQRGKKTVYRPGVVIPVTHL